MKAAQVGAGEYDARMHRAEHLASKHPFGSEVLRFYSRVAEFQKNLYTEITRDIASQLTSRPPGSLRSPMPSGDADLLFSRLRSFLSLIMRDGPSTLAAPALNISQPAAGPNLAFSHALWDFGGINNH